MISVVGGAFIDIKASGAGFATSVTDSTAPGLDRLKVEAGAAGDEAGAKLAGGLKAGVGASSDELAAEVAPGLDKVVVEAGETGRKAGKAFGAGLDEGAVVGEKALKRVGRAGTSMGSKIDAGAKKSSGAISALSGGVIGSLQKGLVVGAVLAGVAVVDLGAKFQSATERLVTGAGESEKNLGLIRKGLLDIGPAVGVGPVEAAKSMYMIESAGFHGRDGLNVFRAAAQGAKADGADLATTGNALTTVMTDIHAPASAAADVMSKMVVAVGQGKMTMQDLASSIHSVMPNASSLGISLAQVTGALATMTAQGVSADQASQNLNHVIVALANPTAVMTKSMASYGLTSTDVARQLGKKGLTGTFEELTDAITSHMGPAGLTIRSAFNQSKIAAADADKEFANMPPRLQAIAAKFRDGQMTSKEYRKAMNGLPAPMAALGRQYAVTQTNAHSFAQQLRSGSADSQTFTAAMAQMTGGQQGLQVALHLTGDNAVTFRQNVAKIAGAASDAKGNVHDWAQVQGTLSQKLLEAKAKVESMAVSAGTVLLPAISKLVDVFTNGILPALSAVVHWIGANKDVLIPLVVIIGSMVAAWKIYTTVVKIAEAAQVAYNLVLEANPVGLVVVAIVGLIAIIYELVKHWKAVAEFLEKRWHSAIKSATAVIKPFTQIPKEVEKLWGTIEKFFGTLWKKVGHIFVLAVEVILAVFLPFIGLPILIATHWKAIEKFFDKLWKSVKKIFTEAISAVVGFVTKLPGQILHAIESLAGDLYKAATDAWNRFEVAGTEVFDAILNFVTGIPGKIIGGIARLATDLYNTAKAAWNRFADACHEVVMAVINYVIGFPAAVVRGLVNIGSALYGVAKAGWNRFKDGATEVFGDVLRFVGHIPDAIIGALGDTGGMLLDVGKAIVQGLINGITSMFGDISGAIGGIVGMIRHIPIIGGLFGSPSPYYTIVGKAIGEGLTNGINANVSMVHAAAGGLAEGVHLGYKSKAKALPGWPTAGGGMASGPGGPRRPQTGGQVIEFHIDATHSLDPRATADATVDAISTQVLPILTHLLASGSAV